MLLKYYSIKFWLENLIFMHSISNSLKQINLSYTPSKNNNSSFQEVFHNRIEREEKERAAVSPWEKVDSILKSLKEFKKSQSTSDLQSLGRVSLKNSKNSVKLNEKKENWLIGEKMSRQLNEHCVNEVENKVLPPTKQIRIFKKQKNCNDQKKKDQLISDSYQLNKVVSLDVLDKLNLLRNTERIKNQNLKDNVFLNKNVTVSLQQHKKSLQAIKQKLLKYGIRTNVKQLYDSKCDSKMRTMLKSKSSIGLGLNEEINTQMDNEFSLNKVDLIPRGQDISLQRPLISLKQNISFFYNDLFDKASMKRGRNKIHQSQATIVTQNHTQNRSPLKSFARGKSITQAPVNIHQINPHLNINNSTDQIYSTETNSNKKKLKSQEQKNQSQRNIIQYSPNSNSSKSKSQQTSNYSENLTKTTKQNQSVNIIKNTSKPSFDPLFSFYHNKNLSQSPCNLNLKQTMETDCPKVKIERKMSIKDFKLGKLIGKGKFGRVFICTHKQTGFLSAIKIIKKQIISKQRSLEQLIRQVKIQTYLNDSNSVKMYGCFCDTENIYFLLEYCADGQLYSLLQTKNKFKEQEAIPIIKDICQGLDHLHKLGIIHRDVKPENIVLSFTKAKLCDFGWSVNSKNEKRQTFCGTPLYISPQLIMNKKYDEKVDIWALGIIVFQLLTGKLPFHISHEMHLQKIVTDEVKCPDYLSKNAKDFIHLLLQRNPFYRNDIETVLKHKFLVEGMQMIKNKTKLT